MGCMTGGAAMCDPAATCKDGPTTFSCTCPTTSVDVYKDGTLCLSGFNCSEPTVLDPMSASMINGDTNKGGSHYSFGAGACPGSIRGAGANAKEIVYSLTAPADGAFTFTVTSMEFKPAIYVVTDCANLDTTCVGSSALDCDACSQQFSLAVQSGTTYFVIVDGLEAGQVGKFQLQVDGK
jgi:hypothetical protein